LNFILLEGFVQFAKFCKTYEKSAKILLKFAEILLEFAGTCTSLQESREDLPKSTKILAGQALKSSKKLKM